jgi:hypothetical protein
MVEAYMTKVFFRIARKADFSMGALLEAASSVASGRFDADLGGGVFKQRVARRGQGKSGGFRVIVLFRSGSRVFFVYGFAKNAKGNLSEDELTAFRKLADKYLSLSAAQIALAKRGGELMMVEGNDDREEASEE